jgi:hypothetical protein
MRDAVAVGALIGESDVRRRRRWGLMGKRTEAGGQSTWGENQEAEKQALGD